jgi:hypothetical protein
MIIFVKINCEKTIGNIILLPSSDSAIFADADKSERKKYCAWPRHNCAGYS